MRGVQFSFFGIFVQHLQKYPFFTKIGGTPPRFCLHAYSKLAKQTKTDINPRNFDRQKQTLKIFCICYNQPQLQARALGQVSRLGLQARALGQDSRLGLQARAPGQGSRLGLQDRALGQGSRLGLQARAPGQGSRLELKFFVFAIINPNNSISRLGLQPRAQSYLKDRSQYVNIKGHHSKIQMHIILWCAAGWYICLYSVHYTQYFFL